ncbi:hypothetical protein BT96DRAFT_988717 [Gymnopus androsaceus JB14]|uniref:Uncharacterized protein n=1 Tax=Gymnopus androsaceus JB14 TaxID=1447944 RepID=A0A6A4I5I7_9AGAR|nr:hypothetical protein BT96DRAFT_988717 [Gymnopus androsaceus JB14]
MSKIAYVYCTFAASAFETRRGMRLLVLALRRVHHDLSFIQLSFKGYNSLSNEVFEDLIREVQRTRCRSFRIYGTVAFKHSSLDFNSHINHSLNLFSIPESLVLSQPLWLCKFLNSSLGLSSIIAQSTKEWTQILPKLYLPSLGALTFWGDIPSDAQTNIEVLVDFSNRHHSLSMSSNSLDNSKYSRLSSKMSIPTSTYPVSHRNIPLKSTRKMNFITFGTSSRSYPPDAALRLLILHAERNTLATKSTLRRRALLEIHLSASPFVFQARYELAINWLEWDLTRKSSFAQAVADEWPSVNMLTINYTETRKCGSLVASKLSDSVVKYGLSSTLCHHINRRLIDLPLHRQSTLKVPTTHRLAAGKLLNLEK